MYIYITICRWNKKHYFVEPLLVSTSIIMHLFNSFSSEKSMDIFNNNHVFFKISFSVTNACVGKPDGNIQHPFECVYFIACAHGKAFVKDCGNGLHYVPWLNRCEYPENYPCDVLLKSGK